MKKQKNFKPRMVLGGQPAKTINVPTKQEVTQLVREALLPDIKRILDTMSGRIAHLYTEEAKTAVILNSLAELLIMKGVVEKDKLQALVVQNQKVLEENYRRATEQMKAAAEESDEKQPADTGNPPEPVAQTVCKNGEGEPPQAPTPPQG